MERDARIYVAGHIGLAGLALVRALREGMSPAYQDFLERKAAA